MEFRIFFPIVEEFDRTWMDPIAADKYVNALGAIPFDSASEPVRTDSYFVTRPFFGLKYRSGEKLELKIRDKAVINGIEKWKKSKLGKKEFARYRGDILENLQNAGYTELLLEDPSLSGEKYVALKKTRKNAYFGEVVTEVCNLEVIAEESKVDSSLQRRKWLSVAVEGNTDEIQEFLKHPDDPLRIVAALKSVHDALSPNFKEAAAHGFLPVVSGYPLFVHCISGAVSEEEVERDVLGVWHALQESL
jgi:hypothetical protein